MTAEPEILFEKKGQIGLVTLNRPKALNALTLNMIREFQPVLDAWAEDDSVRAVVVRGAGEKAFCAGGDVRAVYDAGKSGGDLPKDFFREEYILNHCIFNYAKPYVALIDGITMGGGVGISILGSHRVVGRTLLAMPETAIGLFPDVGGSYFLPRLPGSLGTYLALTGARIKAADSLYSQMATHYVPTEKTDDLVAALAAAEFGDDAKATVDAVIAGLAGDAGEPPLADVRDQIDRCFSKDSVEEIIEALKAEGSDWATAQVEALGKLSPTSMKISLEQLKRGESQDFETCMIMEYRMSQACMAGHDFYEGIRSVLVDKDHNPTWSPATLAEVTEEMVEQHFAPLGDRDLSFS
ncbi:enoyl-CoA hydratase/isomerase family protein [Rhodovibrionaceae bacterium A322]